MSTSRATAPTAPALVPEQGLSGIARRLVQAVAAVYAAGILWMVWLSRELTFASLARDPLFAGYSIAVVLYVLGR